MLLFVSRRGQISASVMVTWDKAFRVRLNGRPVYPARDMFSSFGPCRFAHLFDAWVRGAVVFESISDFRAPVDGSAATRAVDS